MAPNAPEPPHNLDAEESILGAILLSPDAALAKVIETGIHRHDFYRASHGAIYEAMLGMFSDGTPIDPITVGNRLAELGWLAEAGGQERIHELASLVPAAGNVGHYAEIVREMALLRGMTVVGELIQRYGWDRPAPTPELIERAEKAMFDLVASRDASETITLKQAVADTFTRIETLHREGKEVIGLATGYKWLDRMTTGLQPGNLVIVAARPSMGKTALALGIAANVAVRAGEPVALFTMEMNAGEVTQRLLCSEALVESQKVRTGKLNMEEWQQITDAAGRLSNAPVLIDEAGMLSALELRSKARHLKMRHPKLALVIVDYLQLMTSGSRAENRNQDVSQISRALKVLAGELKLPVVALSQLSRQVEARHDKRPMLSDLRESGSLEQDADVVMMLYRDDYYHEDDIDSEQRGIAEINIVKQRNGPTGTVKLSFVERYARFADMP